MSAARPRPPDDVFFPVVPMLDMAFQLLAFFVLTFRPPSGETRIDLDLPAAPAALPAAPSSSAAGMPDLAGLETDLVIDAAADADGRLKTLRLAGAPLDSPGALADRLRRYVQVVGGKPVRVTIAADSRLLYRDAAPLIGACTAAGVAAVRLAGRPEDAP